MEFYVDRDIKKAKRIFPMQGRQEYLRYDMNENPEGLPLEFVEAVKKEITPEFLATYPEQGRFAAKYADYMGVRQENVLATNGSDMAIRYILETFGEKGKEILTVAPSFEMYRVNCDILGYVHVPVNYKPDLSISVEDIVNSIGENTRLVVLVNPNNPMGNVYTESEIKLVLQRAGEYHAIVVVDEAYHYFYKDTSIDLLQSYDNLIILRTFSKLFSLAACRLGVIISSQEIIAYLKNLALSFDVNSIALLFGERLLESPEIEKQLIASEKQGYTFMEQELSARGYTYITCEGNFIFIKPQIDVCKLDAVLQNKYKVLVKTYSSSLLKSYIRVSVGSENAMRKFISAFFEADRLTEGETYEC